MRIGCLGDSNTKFGPPDAPTRRSWVDEAMPLAPEHDWRNYAVGGSSVSGYVVEGWSWGPSQLQRALGDGCTGVIAAFGTNDLGVLNASRDAIVDAYCNLVKMASPIPVVPATTPWRTDRQELQSRITDLNKRLRALARKGWLLLDFDSGELVDALWDGVHVTEAGQVERARRAVALVRGLSA